MVAPLGPGVNYFVSRFRVILFCFREILNNISLREIVFREIISRFREKISSFREIISRESEIISRESEIISRESEIISREK